MTRCYMMFESTGKYWHVILQNKNERVAQNFEKSRARLFYLPRVSLR